MHTVTALVAISLLAKFREKQFNSRLDIFLTDYASRYLPDPVLPTMPTFSFGLMVNRNPLNTKGSSGLYLIVELSKLQKKKRLYARLDAGMTNGEDTGDD